MNSLTKISGSNFKPRDTQGLEWNIEYLKVLFVTFMREALSVDSLFEHCSMKF